MVVRSHAQLFERPDGETRGEVDNMFIGRPLNCAAAISVRLGTR